MKGVKGGGGGRYPWQVHSGKVLCFYGQLRCGSVGQALASLVCDWRECCSNGIVSQSTISSLVPTHRFFQLLAVSR